MLGSEAFAHVRALRLGPARHVPALADTELGARVERLRVPVDRDVHSGEGGIWGFGPDDIWAAGTAGQVAHWDGGAWRSVRHQPIGAPYLHQFHAVHGSPSAGVFVVGQVLGAEGNHGIIFKHEAQ